ncbi:MAG TPA: hypothetical protein VGC45_15845 [Gryllotalpicola sp.]
MDESATPAEIAATRHLIGLSQAELADELSVGRHAVKDWESGRFAARAGVIRDLGALRAGHDAEVARLAQGAEDGVLIQIPRGPKPQGWYLALAARVLDRVPDAMLEWAD